MKHFFRFLCVMAMLCYSLSGFGETTSMRVGDSYRIIVPDIITYGNFNSEYHSYQFTWSGIDAVFFDVQYSVSHSSTDAIGNNVANITLKQPFEGKKTIQCVAKYILNNYQQSRTYTYEITCSPVDIALYPTVMSLDMGQSQTLQWQFNPSNPQYGATVTFSSNDISIADVDFNGKITARGAGTTTITATTNYFTTATCQVTVNPMLATSINLNQSAMNLTVGSSQKLTATVLPAGASDKSVTWTSSDESIATVDANGNVTGITTGLATITATTNDGSNLGASCAVTVSGITANAIRLDKTELEMSAGQSYKLTATVLPAGAQQRVTWSSSDPSVARVVGGTVYAQAMGECLITARTLDGTNLTADCLIMVYPEGEVPTPTGLTGDMNGDGKISIADVTALIDYLLSGNSSNNSGSNEGALDGLIW